MTPEQLEAHRVRFEQQYTHNQGHSAGFVLSCRRGPRYTNGEITTAWQGYQWALADAQRAAPVSEAVHAPFKAMAQGETDYSVDVFPIESTEFGSMMTIGAQEGAIYITKQQAVIFWNLTDAIPQPVEVQRDLVDVLQELMEWQVKNVKRWHNSAYDNAATVLERYGITPTSAKGGAM